MGSGLHARVPHASPCPWVDHPVSGRLPATCRPFGLAFAPAPAVPALTSRRTTTRRLILQKARRHSRPLTRTPLRPAGSARFQALFHSPRRGAFHRSLTVLVPYRSPAVFSLGPWSTQLPTRFRVSDGTHAPLSPPPPTRHLRDSHPLRSTLPVSFGYVESQQASGRYPAPEQSCYPRTAARTSSYAARVWAPPVSLAATPGILSSPQGTEMFQFPQCPPVPPDWYHRSR